MRKKQSKLYLLSHIIRQNALLPALILGFAAGVGSGLLLPQNSFLNAPQTVQTTIVQTQKLNCSVCFTPGQACLPLIIQALDHAQKSIHMQAYSLTSKPIANALLRAHQRGVSVTIIADKSQQRERHTQIKFLNNAGISVYIDHKPAIAHNKVILIDSETVISGSYNFSNAAENRNAENVLIIKSKEIVALYQRNFKNRLLVSKPFI
ncbi:MAG: phospholipase D family protein [Candidatus Paracaedibacteraceae bacterium]|nr:phospholipase D family protein [Candidatus Paracaedibacteraceae bacterium]